MPLLKETCRILMQQAPPEVELAELKSSLLKALKHEGVVDLHDFHVWTIADRRYIASLHMVVRPDDDGRFSADQYNKLATKAKSFLHAAGIHISTLQPEFTTSKKPSAVGGEWCARNFKVRTDAPPAVLPSTADPSTIYFTAVPSVHGGSFRPRRILPSTANPSTIYFTADPSVHGGASVHGIILQSISLHTLRTTY